MTSLSVDLLTGGQIWKRRGCNVLIHDDGERQGWSYLADVRLCPNGASRALSMVWHEHGTDICPEVILTLQLHHDTAFHSIE
jgi:hypothetical protein